MQKYLVKFVINVADEDDAILLTVVDESTLKKIKKSTIEASMFQCDNDPEYFEEMLFGSTVEITEISDEEYEILKKLNIYTESGSIRFYDNKDNRIELPDWRSLS